MPGWSLGMGSKDYMQRVGPQKRICEARLAPMRVSVAMPVSAETVTSSDLAEPGLRAALGGRHRRAAAGDAQRRQPLQQARQRRLLARPRPLWQQHHFLSKVSSYPGQETI